MALGLLVCAGSGVLSERKDLELAVADEGDAQIVERHDFLDQVRISLGKVHRDIPAIGMSHHDQMAVIRVRLDLLQLVDCEHDIGNAPIILQPAADIFLADLRHHRIVGFEVVLNAHDHVAAGGKNVGEKGVLGELDGIAMIEDRQRQFDHVGHRLQFPVAANGDIDGDRTVASQRVVECERLVMDRHLLAVKYATVTSAQTESTVAMLRFMMCAPANVRRCPQSGLRRTKQSIR
jgi:hypothetical protein